MTTVRFTGWNPGFNKVRMNAILREDGGLGLAEAKQLVDAILEDRGPALTLEESAARRLADRATECGATVTVEAE